MSVRAIIVDDEPLARKGLLRHLQAHAGIQVIRECGDGRAAVESILAERPDLVFLDIQMPEMDGFQVIERIGKHRMPLIVFVTAYDQYALSAFDANAVDYLLKPFRKERFERALARVMDRIKGNPETDMTERIAAAMDALGRRQGYLQRIPVSQNGRIRLVAVEEIEWIEASGNYARLHSGTSIYEIRETLTSLERKLDPNGFARVHRSAIVNLHRVKEIHPWFHGHHVILLESGRKVRMSRYQRNVSELLDCCSRRH